MNGYDSPVLASPAPLVELELKGYLEATKEIRALNPGEDSIRVRDVLERMFAEWQGGARTFLVAVDSLGGTVWSGVVLFCALRAISEQGGTSVAYVADHAGSAAVSLILGADLVVARPDSVIWPHPVVAGKAVEQAGVDLVEEFESTILRARTLATAEQVQAWVGGRSTLDDPGGEPLLAERALALGFIDEVGGLQAARRLAAGIAAGNQSSSRRSSELSRRTMDPELASSMRLLRTVGAEMIGDVMTRE